MKFIAIIAVIAAFVLPAMGVAKPPDPCDQGRAAARYASRRTYSRSLL
jgi:hypothetical protein